MENLKKKSPVPAMHLLLPPYLSIIMKIFALVLLVLLTACTSGRRATNPKLPPFIKGLFADDYGLRYTISDTVFSMDGVGKYHIKEWNEAGQYLLVQNDSSNKAEKGLYSRIDYMSFSGMEPFKWGYCLIVYDAPDTAAARRVTAADRTNPKKGCNGYPFSRMKRLE